MNAEDARPSELFELPYFLHMFGSVLFISQLVTFCPHAQKPRTVQGRPLARADYTLFTVRVDSFCLAAVSLYMVGRSVVRRPQRNFLLSRFAHFRMRYCKLLICISSSGQYISVGETICLPSLTVVAHRMPLRHAFYRWLSPLLLFRLSGSAS